MANKPCFRQSLFIILSSLLYMENRNHVSHGNKHILKCLILHKGRIIWSWGSWGHCSTSSLSKMPTNSSFSALNFNLDFSEIQINFVNNLVEKAFLLRAGLRAKHSTEQKLRDQAFKELLLGFKVQLWHVLVLWSWASYWISVKQGVNHTSA